MGFLLSILSCQAFLVVVLIYLGFHNLGSQLFLEDAPLALGPNFGPLVEFWIQLPLLKTQIHVVIALGMTRGINTKTSLTDSNLGCVLVDPQDEVKKSSIPANWSTILTVMDHTFLWIPNMASFPHWYQRLGCFRRCPWWMPSIGS